MSLGVTKIDSKPVLDRMVEGPHDGGSRNGGATLPQYVSGVTEEAAEAAKDSKDLADLVAGQPRVRMHDQAGEELMNSILLEGETFWEGVEKNDCKEKFGCDYWRLIELEGEGAGFLPQVTGPAQDLPIDLVSELIFRRMNLLPQFSDEVRAITNLNAVHDPVLDADCQDNYQLVDASFMWSDYFQRMCIFEDADSGNVFLSFELIDETNYLDMGLSDDDWAHYQGVKAETTEAANLGWRFFGTLSPSVLYGMFILEPTTATDTRVTYSSKFVFSGSKKASFIQRISDWFPGVIGSAFQATFLAYHDTIEFYKEQKEQETNQDEPNEVLQNDIE